MKTFVVSMLIFVSVVTEAQYIDIRYARVFTPADHLSLLYEHWTNSAINFSLGGFVERSRKNNLNLSCYGAEMLGEYASNREGYEAGVFGWKLGAGASWQVENEPWIYKDWPASKRSSFGAIGELAGEWFMTDNFTLRAFAQQKYLLNQLIGRYRFLIGISLAIRLNSF